MNCISMVSFYFAYFFIFGFFSTERFCHAKLNIDAKRKAVAAA